MRGRRVLSAAALACALAAASIVYFRRPLPTPAPTPVVGSNTAGLSSAAPAPTPSSALAPLALHLYRMTEGGKTQLLRNEDRVRPGDHLFLEYTPTFNTYLYLVDEDERGRTYLLFPLRGKGTQNPLLTGQNYRLPRGTKDESLNWEVTSTGGREHILVFASRERASKFEDAIAHIPVARPGQTAAALPGRAMAHLRGIGGLTEVNVDGTRRKISSLAKSLVGDLSRGPWLIEIVLSNGP